MSPGTLEIYNKSFLYPEIKSQTDQTPDSLERETEYYCIPIYRISQKLPVE